MTLNTIFKPSNLFDPFGFVELSTKLLTRTLSDGPSYLAEAVKKTDLLIKEQKKQSEEALEKMAVTNAMYLADHPLSKDFDVELIENGEGLERPIGYALFRIRAKVGYEFDPRIVKATAGREKSTTPVVVFAPKAGKTSAVVAVNPVSEIPILLKIYEDGFVYLFDYLPWPDKNQDLGAVCEGTATLLAKVCELHPEAKNGPNIIANCQAGWLIDITGSRHAGKFKGTLMDIGSPKSFLLGKRSEKQNRAAMRFLSIYGTRLAELLADLYGGYIPGFLLTLNFDILDIAYTLNKNVKNWREILVKELRKRTTDFNGWWNSGIYFTKKEFLEILKLFIGDEYRKGVLVLDGKKVRPQDNVLRTVSLGSEEDTIVPIEQVLTDIQGDYGNLENFKQAGQVLCIQTHPTAGHMKIFVGADMLLEHHLPTYAAMDQVAELAPGIYEIVISNNEAIFHERDFSFIAEITRDADLDRELFERMQARNAPLDRGYSCLSPLVQFPSKFFPKELLGKMHPATVRHLMFSNANPAMWFLPQHSRLMESFLPEPKEAVPEDNLFKKMEEVGLSWLSNNNAQLELWKNALLEQIFRAIAQ